MATPYTTPSIGTGCRGQLWRVLLPHEAPAHRSHRDARHRPAEFCGCICRDFPNHVNGLPNCRHFALGYVSGHLLPDGPTLDELLPRNLHGDGCWCVCDDAAIAELPRQCTVGPAILCDTFFLSRRIAAHSPAHSLKPLQIRFSSGNRRLRQSLRDGALGFSRRFGLAQALEN